MVPWPEKLVAYHLLPLLTRICYHVRPKCGAERGVVPRRHDGSARWSMPPPQRSARRLTYCTYGEEAAISMSKDNSVS